MRNLLELKTVLPMFNPLNLIILASWEVSKLNCVYFLSCFDLKVAHTFTQSSKLLIAWNIFLKLLPHIVDFELNTKMLLTLKVENFH